MLGKKREGNFSNFEKLPWCHLDLGEASGGPPTAVVSCRTSVYKVVVCPCGRGGGADGQAYGRFSGGCQTNTALANDHPFACGDFYVVEDVNCTVDDLIINPLHELLLSGQLSAPFRNCTKWRLIKFLVHILSPFLEKFVRSLVCVVEVNIL